MTLAGELATALEAPGASVEKFGEWTWRSETNSVLYLAGRRWFEMVDGGDVKIFDMLPFTLRYQYFQKAQELIQRSGVPFGADPRRVFMWGRSLL